MPAEKKSDLPSNTIPNQSLTVQEIYQRFATGRHLPTVTTTYDDDGQGRELVFDDYLPDLQHLDLADRQNIMEQAKEKMDKVKKELDSLAKSKKIKLDKENADLRKRLDALEKEKADQDKKEPGKQA